MLISYIKANINIQYDKHSTAFAAAPQHVAAQTSMLPFLGCCCNVKSPYQDLVLSSTYSSDSRQSRRYTDVLTSIPRQHLSSPARNATSSWFGLGADLTIGR